MDRLVGQGAPLAVRIENSIDSDDPGFFSTGVVAEYALVGRLLRLDRSGYGDLARSSVHHSFAPEPLRIEILSAIDAWVEEGGA